MDSPGLSYLAEHEEGPNHKMRGALEALQNLMFLIREDVEYPERVEAYAHQADDLLLTALSHLS